MSDTPAINKTPENPTIAAARPPLHLRPAFWLLIILPILCVIGGWLYWLHARQYEETDDANVDGEIVQVSARVAGQISKVEIQDNQDIAAGTVLVIIDPKDLQAKLNEKKAALGAAQAKAEAAVTQVSLTRAQTDATLVKAQAGVEQAKASLLSSESRLAAAKSAVQIAEAEATRTQANLKRYQSLDPRAVSQQQLDAAVAAANSSAAALDSAKTGVAAAESAIAEAKAREAQAQGVLADAMTGPQQVAFAEAKARDAQAAVDEARATADEAELNLSYTTVRAPVAGRVTRRAAREGQYVQAGQLLLAVVQPEVWITANFKETQLTHMDRGQKVEVRVDTYPGVVFHGTVDSIQAGTGARFSLLPPENATGNFVKVVQRVPVKITLDQNEAHKYMLGPGMSVVPRVIIGTDFSQRPSQINPSAASSPAKAPG